MEEAVSYCEATTRVQGKFRRCEREAGHRKCAAGEHLTTIDGQPHRWHAPPAHTGVVAMPMPAPVRVDWHDKANDWRWYTLLGFAGEWVRLQGRADDDGDQYRGGPIWAHVSEIDSIQEV